MDCERCSGRGGVISEGIEWLKEKFDDARYWDREISYEEKRRLLERYAMESGIPVELAYAVGMTESRWKQYGSSGRPLTGTSRDVGMMQVVPSKHPEYDPERLAHNVRYNIQAGVKVLAWSYRYAKSMGYSGDDLLKSAYAVYNSGLRKFDRPFQIGSYGFKENDDNFWRNYTNKTWEGFDE